MRGQGRGGGGGEARGKGAVCGDEARSPISSRGLAWIIHIIIFRCFKV